MTMIDGHNSIHGRGKIATSACHWIARHWKLALRLLFVPSFVLSIALFVSRQVLCCDELLVVLSLLAVVIVPLMPFVMLRVVKQEEQGLVQVKPTKSSVMALCKTCAKDVVLVVGAALLINILLYFTMLVPLFSWAVVPLALVIKLSDDNTKLTESFVEAVNVIINNFGTFLLCQLSIVLLGVSFVVLPLVVPNLTNDLLREFFAIRINGMLSHLPSSLTVMSISAFLSLLGTFLFLQVGLIINHFFYAFVAKD